MRRLEPTHGVATEGDELTVIHRARAPVREIVHRDHGGNLAAERLGVRRDRQELVQCAALVGLEMRERDPAQALDRHYARDRIAHRRKYASKPRVKQEGLVIDDQVLVEAEPAGHRARRHRCGNTIEPIGDLVDAGVRLG